MTFVIFKVLLGMTCLNSTKTLILFSGTGCFAVILFIGCHNSVAKGSQFMIIKSKGDGHEQFA